MYYRSMNLNIIQMAVITRMETLRLVHQHRRYFMIH